MGRRWRGSDGGEDAAQVGLTDGEVMQLIPVQAGHQPSQGQLVRTCDEDHRLGDLGRVREREADGGMNGLGGLQPGGEVFADCDVEALHLCHGRKPSMPATVSVKSPPETVSE